MLSQVRGDKCNNIVMPDSLPKILQEIHAVSTGTELSSDLSGFESRISAILSAQPDQKNYYLNHTGRELYRKLYYYGLQGEISYSFDSGFRPFLPQWTPAAISTQSWYDVSDSSTLTITNSIVEEIRDKSGNNLNLTANSASDKGHALISSDLNGLDTVYIDGDDGYNANTSYSVAAGNLQAFILTKVETVDNFNDSILASAGTIPNWQLNAASANQFRAQVNSQGGSTPAASADFSSNYRIFNAFFDWDNKVIKSYVDSVVVGSATYSTQLSSNQLLRVYTNRGNSVMPEGKIAEIILCNDVSDTIREKIEGYLAHKWGLQSNLPDTHLYKRVPPFIFDI
jgi:hypothetical protein